MDFIGGAPGDDSIGRDIAKALEYYYDNYSTTPGFMMLANFRVIMRYNPAEAYALAIGHLADRLRGAPPFAQNWPRYERVLSRGERLELPSEESRHA